MKKIVKPDDEEVTVTQAEHRIRMMVQKEVEEIWRGRMEWEDKIHTNNVETLLSELARLSEEVVCLKSRSRASTMAASTGSGGARATSQPVWR